jgi:small-conductance mechanosensitive channel
MIEEFVSAIQNLFGHAGLVSAVGIAAALIVGWVVFAVTFVAARQVASKTDSDVDNMLVRHARAPSRIMIPLIAVLLVVPALPLGEGAGEITRRILSLAITGCVGWYVLASISFIGDLAAERIRIDHADNLREREVRTRVQIFQRVATVLVVVITVAAMLMTIPGVRHVGISLFASAGVAGIVIGFAARSALANLVAGIQIALSAPIRIDDVVIVEGEWGWIEEITTTFVVVRIWDLRRLVVPLSYFIERPFQNWTRITADILGTVFIYADYTVDVPAVREELHRILEGSEKWDGKVWGLQVTNATERTLELRALMSAPNSSDAWTLRCEVREKLLDYLQEHHPESLPLTRAEVHAEGLSAGGPEPLAAA